MFAVDRVEHAAVLRRAGWSYPRIAAEFGVHRNTVIRWLYPAYAERNREASRAVKRRRSGTCELCGGTTRYNGHGQVVSTVCAVCAGRRNGELGRAKRGSGARQQQVLALLAAQQTATSAQILAELGMKKQREMGWLLNHLVRYGLIVRVERGVYALAEVTA